MELYVFVPDVSHCVKLLGEILVPVDIMILDEKVEIAWLDHAIYMTYTWFTISSRCSQIKDPFDELVDIEIANLKNPWSMVSNAKNRSIYTSAMAETIGSGEIQMPEQEVSRRTIAGFPRNLAISSNGGLLAIVGYPVDMETGVENLFIEVFQPRNLQRTKSISLPEEIAHVWCFGQSPDGNFIISHTDVVMDDFKISIVSTNGDRIIRTLDPVAASENRSNTFYSTYYFTFIDDGQIIVVDKYEGQILLLDSQLSDYTVISSNEYQPLQPTRIVYNRGTRMLLIQDSEEVVTPGSSDLYLPIVFVMELNQDDHTARSINEESHKDCQQLDNRTRAVKFIPKHRLTEQTILTGRHFSVGCSAWVGLCCSILELIRVSGLDEFGGLGSVSVLANQKCLVLYEHLKQIVYS